MLTHIILPNLPLFPVSSSILCCPVFTCGSNTIREYMALYWTRLYSLSAFSDARRWEGLRLRSSNPDSSLTAWRLMCGEAKKRPGDHNSHRGAYVPAACWFVRKRMKSPPDKSGFTAAACHLAFKRSRTQKATGLKTA